MKAFRKPLRSSAFLLMVLTLFQSCAVYHKTPVTMEQATQENTKTKIHLKDGRVEKFKFITHQDGQYYGTRLTGKGPVSIPIDASAINKVQVKNKTASILITVIPLTAIAALMIAAANFSIGGFGGL